MLPSGPLCWWCSGLRPTIIRSDYLHVLLAHQQQNAREVCTPCDSRRRKPYHDVLLAPAAADRLVETQSTGRAVVLHGCAAAPVCVIKLLKIKIHQACKCGSHVPEPCDANHYFIATRGCCCAALHATLLETPVGRSLCMTLCVRTACLHQH